MRGGDAQIHKKMKSNTATVVEIPGKLVKTSNGGW